MPLSPGTRLGTYDITGLLGAGGMGEVYRARDLRLDRDVAVKVLPEAVASSPDRLAQFEREARMIAGLNHPSIVTLYSIEEEDGVPFLTMELRDEQDEYFSDGLADELLNVLAKIRGLRVAARASSFQFKGKSEDLAVIGRKLNVATLLDGSVRKAGNRVRISVQLISISDGYHLWSETYDRTLDDIFAVQDDIAQSVVKELRTRLLGEGPAPRGAGRLRQRWRRQRGAGDRTPRHTGWRCRRDT